MMHAVVSSLSVELLRPPIYFDRLTVTRKTS